MTDDLTITLAAAADLAAILAVQKLAYGHEALLYPHDTLPPLEETMADLRALLPRMTFLKAESAGRLLGSVRAELHGQTCHIGRLVVHPACQRHGIGSALVRAIEAHFPHAARYELFTGDLSVNNIRLYQRLGYTIFDSREVSPTLSLVYLEKVGQQA